MLRFWNRLFDKLKMRIKIKQLIAENRVSSAKELNQTEDYERSMLGNDFRYPHDGEVYEAITDVEIHYLTHWSAPYTGGETFVLKQGERIIVEVSDHNPKPISVYAKSTQIERLEREIIPEETRTSEKYGGYSLGIKCTKLKKHFRLID